MKNKKKNYLFSDYVKDEQEKKKSTFKNIREYANYIGVSHTVIHDMLNGKYNAPSPLTAARMCNWFNLTPEMLVSMITNADDAFLEEFNKKYNGELFEDTCKSAIKYFFATNSNQNLHDGAVIDPNSSTEFNKFNLSSLKFVNTDRNSLYDASSYNALCSCDFLDQEWLDDGDKYKVVELAYQDFAIHYLPPRRINKASDNVYADEGFRDFTNKLMYLLTTKKPKNMYNLFLTTSKKLYDEIIEYTKNMNISSANKIEVGIVYCQYRQPQKYKRIIENSYKVQTKVFE